MYLWEPEGYPTEENTLQQFKNLANHPLAFHHVCGMPDAHLGYGMPIGGVFAAKGGIVPNAVGVDIGCGMIALATDKVVGLDIDSEDLVNLYYLIHERVPTGNGPSGNLDTWSSLTHAMPIPVSEPLQSFVRNPDDLGHRQLGTLGGGNHFIELQHDESGRLWIMLHSGSRSLGKRVCDYYHEIALELGNDVPDRDLAFLPEGKTTAFAGYVAAMYWCMKFAELNRRTMLRQVLDCFEEIGEPVTARDLVETHHNFASRETFYDETVWVHRKGAVKALGKVTIPGSMDTVSYIGVGKPVAESFNSCSHGAGRQKGRRAFMREMSGKHDEAVASLSHVVIDLKLSQHDELGKAYKELDAVMDAQVDLVSPLHQLTPLVAIKG